MDIPALTHTMASLVVGGGDLDHAENEAPGNDNEKMDGVEGYLVEDYNEASRLAAEKEKNEEHLQRVLGISQRKAQDEAEKDHGPTGDQTSSRNH